MGLAFCTENMAPTWLPHKDISQNTTRKAFEIILPEPSCLGVLDGHQWTNHTALYLEMSSQDEPGPGWYIGVSWVCPNLPVSLFFQQGLQPHHHHET